MELKGRVRLNVFKDGILIDSFEEHNQVVLSGKQLITFLMSGEPGNWRITKFGVGENSTPPSTLDTSLTNGLIIPVDGYTLLSKDAVQWNFSLDTDEGNGLNIAEFGLFSNDTEQMFARKVRTPAIPKDNSISFSGDWTVWFVECKKTTFSVSPIITTSFSEPILSGFLGFVINASIVSDITEPVFQNDISFAAQSDIVWDTASNIIMPFSVSPSITFNITDPVLDSLFNREYAATSNIISDIQSDIIKT